MRIASVGRAFPPHRYEQDALIAALRAAWSGRFFNPARLEQIHKNVLVGGRNLALPLEDYPALDSFGAANDTFIRVGTDVGALAVTDALTRAGLTVTDVDAIWFVSVTGLSAPSIDARLVNRLGFRPDIKRTPVFGLGCVAGAAGVARVADYLKGHPHGVAILLSVELCSLTIQRDDLSIPNLIATGLFGDGAACVVMVGEERAKTLPDSVAAHAPAVLDSRSIFYPDTEGVMGWQIGERGFRIVLSAEVPEVVHRHLRGDMDRFLADHGLGYDNIGVWVAHPGGPKVLQAMESAFPLPPGALSLTWKSLQEVGNLSSASVLMVLRDTLDTEPAPGTLGVLVAMGPGFCSELVLLRW